MTSCAISAQSSANRSPAKVFLCIILIMISGVILFTLAHAVERHGNDAVTVCNQPPIMQLSSDTRDAHICQLPDGKYGVKITTRDGDVITAFVKEKMKSLSDVVRYLNNRGYY